MIPPQPKKFNEQDKRLSSSKIGFTGMDQKEIEKMNKIFDNLGINKKISPSP